MACVAAMGCHGAPPRETPAASARKPLDVTAYTPQQASVLNEGSATTLGFISSSAGACGVSGCVRVWVESRPGAPGLFGLKLLNQGERLVPNVTGPIAVGGSRGAQDLTLAWPNPDNGRLMAGRLDSLDLQVRGTIAVSTGGGTPFAIGADDVVGAGSTHLLVWADNNQSRMSRLVDGVLQDAPPGQVGRLSSDAARVEVAWDGVRFVVASARAGVAGGGLELTTIGKTGPVTSSYALPVPDGIATDVSIVPVPSGSLLAWQADHLFADGGRSATIGWALLSQTAADGGHTLIDAGELSDTVPLTAPRLALSESTDAGGPVVVMTWLAGRPARSIEGATYVPATGAWLPKVSIVTQHPQAIDCSVSQTGQASPGGCLHTISRPLLMSAPRPELYWLSDEPFVTTAQTQVNLPATANLGAVLREAPGLQVWNLGIDNQSPQQLQQAITFANGRYWTAWTGLTTLQAPWTYLDVRAASFDAQGTPQPQAAQPQVPDGQLQPAIASGDAGLLIAYTHLPPDAQQSSVRARVMGFDGVWRGAELSFADATAPQRWPAAGVLGDGWLVSWHAGRTLDGGLAGLGDLWLTTVDRNAVAGPRALVENSTDRVPAAFAAGPSQTLMVWRSGGADPQLRAARIGLDGGLLDAAPLAVTLTPARHQFTAAGVPPAVAFTGSEYVVVWADQRAADGGLYSRRIGLDGTLFGPASGELLVEANVTGASAVWDGHDVFITWLQPVIDAGSVVAGNWWRPGEAWQADAGVVLFDGALPMRPFVPVATNGQRGVAAAGLRLAGTAPRTLLHALQAGRARGAPCATDDNCASSSCREGVCCVAGCTGPCQTCRADAGAASDGLCGLRAQGTLCRVADAGLCDADDRCTGSAAECPDTFAPATLECRPATVVCDVAERCTGSSPACPADVVAPATTACRQSANACDVIERCNGNDTICPADVRAPEGTACGERLVCSAASECLDCVGAQCDVFGAAPSRSLYGAVQCGSAGAAWPSLALLLGWLLRRRRRATRGLLVLAVLCAAPLAHAEEQAVPSLAFMGLRAMPGTDEGQVKAVSQYLESELKRSGAYKVTSQDDLVAMIGIERQRQLLGCSDEATSCAAEIAGALAADRVLLGSVAQVGEEVLFDLSLLDRSAGRAVGRVSRRLRGQVTSTLDEVVPMLQELLTTDAALQGRSLDFKRSFGGLVIGVRAEGDVLGRGFAPGLTAEYSARLVGAAVTVLYGSSRVGGRVEGRFYPFIAGPVRPYVAAGTTLLVPAVSVRGALGAALMVWRLQLWVDVAYDHFFNVPPSYFADALVISGGAGWHF